MANTPKNLIPVIVRHEAGTEAGLELGRTSWPVSVLVRWADRTECWVPAHRVSDAA